MGSEAEQEILLSTRQIFLTAYIFYEQMKCIADRRSVFMEYVPLYSPGNVGESIFIESLLKANNIHYFIQNEMGSQYVIATYGQSTFYVNPNDFALAHKLLEEHLNVITGRQKRIGIKTQILIAIGILILLIVIIAIVILDNPIV
jgi:hypothetical protein